MSLPRTTIYLDNAATTQIDNEVLDEMLPYLKDKYGNPSASYALGIEARKAKEAARKRVASLINAETEEIFFTSGATESNNWILRAAVNEFSSLGMMITSNVEHASILNTIKEIMIDGYTRVPCDGNGVIQPKYFKEFLDFVKPMRYPFVSIMMANNELGTINNVKDLAEIAHEHYCLFHTDATQALGHMKINVKEMGIDAMSASAHKIFGPKGTGFLYVRRGSALYDAFRAHKLIIGGHQESGLRGGTENVAGIVGLGKACELTEKFIRSRREAELNIFRKNMYMALSEEIGAVSNVGFKKLVLPILNIRIPGINNQELVQLLDEEGVCVSTGSACNENEHVPSHVLRALGLSNEEISETIRISIGRKNTVEEINTAVEIIKDKVNILRLLSDN